MAVIEYLRCVAIPVHMSLYVYTTSRRKVQTDSPLRGSSSLVTFSTVASFMIHVVRSRFCIADLLTTFLFIVCFVSICSFTELSHLFAV